MKQAIRKLTPKFLINLYHGLWSFMAAVFYGFPSKKMVLIGVTGTNGKSTTVNLIAKALEASGHKTALVSTTNFKIGEKEWLNDKKMTMLGRHFLHKFLSDAHRNGCVYVVIENSSEGLEQNRHWGTYYDVAVFTNLTPEHIDSHGSFYNYKAAKKILFDSLNRPWRKKLKGETIPTLIVANGDDPHTPYYFHSQSDRKITYGIKESNLPSAHLQAQDVTVGFAGVKYKIGNETVNLKLKGFFDVYNTLAALAVAQMLDVPLTESVKILSEERGVAGRLEIIQEQPFMVLIDYAPEPESMRQLYKTIDLWRQSKDRSEGVLTGQIIHVLGSAGGGRDVSRRPILGELAAQNADYVIITNEDPYDDDPMRIIDDVVNGSVAVGKILDKDLFKIPDRREAIAKSLSLANEGDLVLITGKGSEQKIALAGGKYIDWDDRVVAKEELQKIRTQAAV